MITRGGSKFLHYLGRLIRSLAEKREFVQVRFNRSVALTRYGALVILIALIGSASFFTPSASSGGSSSNDGEPNAPATASHVVPPTKLFVSAIKKTGKAGIATDKNDYAPGDKVIITGSGWKPRETIRLRVHRSSGTRDEVFTLKANSTGRFRNDGLLIRKRDLGVAFVVTARGMSSRYTAEITFADGNITIKSAYDGQTNAGGLQTFTLTKQIFTGNTNCSSCGGAPTTVTGVDASTGHTFALNSGDSALLTSPPVSDQNGPFGNGWFSPTMSAFTPDMVTNRKICIQGTANPATYVAPFRPGIVSLDNTCTNSKTLFNLGDTICVKVFGDPALNCNTMPKFFEISIMDPDGNNRNCMSNNCNTDMSVRVNADQGTYMFTLPATDTTMSTDNRGRWTAQVRDCNGNGQGQVLFLVHNPTAGHEAVDVQVLKLNVSTFPIQNNGTVQYEILVGNIGPEPAQNVTLMDTIPTHTTLVSFKQLSGPAFTCMAPAMGGTGTISCTIATLPVGTGVNGPVVATQTAKFRLVVKGDGTAMNGDTITNTASASSNMSTETHPNNNMSSANNNVGSGGCSMACPDDITMTATTTCNSPPGSCGPGTPVTYPNGTPTPSGTCFAVSCSPTSGSCFPVGTTSVNCGDSNAHCNFLVTVNAGCTVTCPANITKSNDTDQCGAMVTYPNATESGPQCGGTITCVPASGSFFPVGTTTVTCSDGSFNCPFTVTVTDTQPPSITCPSNITAQKDQMCGKVVTYPTPTPTDNCPGATASCSPPSGTCFPVGTTTVTCTAKDTSMNTATCTFTVTVSDCTITCPANQTGTTGPGATQCCGVVNYPAPMTTGSCGTVSCNPPTGTCFPVGMTTVTCSTMAGPSCSFTVTVTDTTPPTINCPSKATAVGSVSCPIQTSATANFTVTATDNCPGTPTVVCKNQNNQVVTSGQPFPVGTTTVTCTATDASGNSSMCTFPVSAFSFCLQDETNPGNFVLINASTGAYDFFCNGVEIASGIGTLNTKGCIGSIEHYKGDRRVYMEWDTTAAGGKGAGTAIVQLGPNNTRCQITDKNMSNNTCAALVPAMAPVGKSGKRRQSSN